jgi:hypothetical protein
MKTLRVSDNRRLLVEEDGTPFFWLADTAWELFHQLTREQALMYLRNRAEKGFNVVQAVCLAEFHGLTRPNAYGHLPLIDQDPTHLNDAYFQHVDWVIDEAAKLGIRTALLPTWGDKWNIKKKWGLGPEIFAPENARAFGRLIGERYKNKDVIWVLGGDRPIDTDKHRLIIRVMAEGLEQADGGRNLMTFHPNGGTSSTKWVHDESWLDFHMMQSGHGAPFWPNWRMIRHDRSLAPTRPVLDGEPIYEHHPFAFQQCNPVSTDYHVRCAAYWSVFAGGCGHTYGCHDIWPFATKDWRPVPTLLSNWDESLDLPGAFQMGHLRRLMESRPQLTRIPAIATSDRFSPIESIHTPTTRDGTDGENDATYLMMYSPIVRVLTIDTTIITGKSLRIWRFNPRTGEAKLIAEQPNDGGFTVQIPGKDEGADWVWIIDDASAGYPEPGTDALGR